MVTEAPAIVLVEDDPNIADLVDLYLRDAGFRVYQATSGQQGLDYVRTRRPRLAILDIGLPGEVDGIEVCRRIRADGPLPVIMLTARDDEVDRVLGLELGADDYITKPFSPRELVARVRAVLRRAEPENGADLVTAGDIVLEHGGRNVSVAGSPVDLTGMEFDLLAFLLAHPGTVWSRERLLERVWGLSFPGGTRTVDVHVAQLRKKLDRPDLIRTVRGSGYKAVT
jgi:DNA-binding response OmpR family regulator